MKSEVTINSIKKLNDVLELHAKERQRFLQMMKEMGQALTQTRTERDNLARDLAKTRKELAEYKAANTDLTKEVNDLNQQVETMVAAINMVQMELADGNSNTMDVASTIYSEFKAATPAPTRPQTATNTTKPVGANPTSKTTAAKPLVIPNVRQSEMAPTSGKPAQVATDAQVNVTTEMLENGFKEIEKLLANSLNKAA